jgi:hypothetical protein
MAFQHLGNHRDQPFGMAAVDLLIAGCDNGSVGQ